MFARELPGVSLGLTTSRLCTCAITCAGQSDISRADAPLTAMDGVHGRSRVTSGASRLHHVAGFTQIAPGALPTSGKADGPNTGVKGVKGCWLARGSSSSLEGQISPP